MLTRLHVVHYALIDDAEIEFGDGLNIITGETGAGKSILIGALGLVLGMRASADVIRTGEDRCRVEAEFRIPEGHAIGASLSEQGIELDDGALIVRREVLSEGRSRCFVNGLAIPARNLQALGKLLVDLHGQHDHQSLLDPERHLDFLDGYGRLENLREKTAQVFALYSEKQGALKRHQDEARRLKERRELLEFQVQEISEISPDSDEDDQLAGERSVLEHAERLTETAQQIEALLYEGDDSVADRIGAAERMLADAERIDATLASRSGELRNIRFSVEETARFFADYGRSLEHNPERLAEITDRLEVLGRLKKKYGGDIASVLAYAEAAQKELDRSVALDASVAVLIEEIDAARATLAAACGELATAREEAARSMESAIQSALAELGMPSARFEVRLYPHESSNGDLVVNGVPLRATATGTEAVEFYCSMNPGEDIRALVKVASGGEVSRIMLAMKSVLSATDSVQVLIFDEIDIGISGRIAEVVGRKLQNLAKSTQTISITHLPQIARMADRHFSVRKDVDQGRTRTRVVPLLEEERTVELAKLLGGEKISELTMEHAREMLSQN